MSQLDRDFRACVEFLAADAWRWFRAQHAHTPDANGLCVAHQREPWPCPTARLAQYAELLYRSRSEDTMPIPRCAP